MILRVPDYYEAFHCIANECRHNCCEANWEIDVDEKTYEQYAKLTTEFGKRLRAAIKKDKLFHFKLKHGRCPFLKKDHLCEVYETLGEKALCKVCTVYPRMQEVYGGLQEKILGLSCEEVGRILFSRIEPVRFIEHEVPNAIEQQPEKERIEQYDRHQIERARDEAIRLLQDRRQPFKERLGVFLLFCHEIQQCLDEDQADCLDQVIQKFETSAVEVMGSFQSVSEGSVHTLFMNRMDLMMAMDVVEEEWGDIMNNVLRVFYDESHEERYAQAAAQLEQIYPEIVYQYEHLMVYFADRYLMQAVYDGDFWGPAKYSVMGYLTIHDMDMMKCFIQGGHYSLEDRIETVRLFCKQVEHSEQSESYLKEKVATESVFGLEALLKQLGCGESELMESREITFFDDIYIDESNQ